MVCGAAVNKVMVQVTAGNGPAEEGQSKLFTAVIERAPAQKQVL